MPTIEIIDEKAYPEVYRPFRKVLTQWHNALVESKARIVLVWNRDGMISKGFEILGKCQKATSLLKTLTDYDFSITLNAISWEELSNEQREALIDHELMHARADKIKGEWVFSIRRHDLEEFRDIVERHGMYKADIQAFVEAANSGPILPFEKRETA